MNPTLEPPATADTPAIEPPLMGENGHKRNGYIAKLPQATRDQINRWLDDGHTYPQIIKDLGEHGKDLNPGHFTQWYQGGYQAYLRHQDWREDLRALRESAADVAELTDEGHKFQETLVQLGLTEIFRALKDPQTKTDPLNYIRLFNALARLNREALGLRKYNDLRADKAVAQTLATAKIPSPEEARDIMFQAFEKGLGLKAAPGPIGPDVNDHLAKHGGSRVNLAQTSPRGEGQGEGELVAPKPADPRTHGAEDSQSKIQNQNSKTETPPTTTANPDSLPLTHPPTYPLTTSPAAPPLQNSLTPVLQSPEPCYACAAPLPPAPRRSPSCLACGAHLYPLGTAFDHCPVCDAFQAILPDGERHSPECERCNQTLPPPGHRFLSQCPACALKLQNFNSQGARIADRCPGCRTPLPLLEPIPPPPAEPLANAA